MKINKRGKSGKAKKASRWFGAEVGKSDMKSNWRVKKHSSHTLVSLCRIQY